MTSQFVPTATNMVTVVRNIVGSYGMGPIRAIAQEPVQNSKDASRGRPVHVEYKLHRRGSHNGGEDTYMLTVTDSNTSGLQGPVLSFDDIQARGNNLGKDENWAAFEGLGFSKESPDALGSRGQGKASFLYHSKLPSQAIADSDRMMMLYDTLLSNGEYRLGVRYANPYDVVRHPPYLGDEARKVVTTQYDAGGGTIVELGLAPLTQIGTRVIVPYLSNEVVESFQSGELHQWLQRCWWRAIQTKEVVISVVDVNNTSQEIEAPSWWQDEPWKSRGHADGIAPTVWNQEDIPIDTKLKIKRMVFLYNQGLSEADLDADGPQFWGVQLLRGQQWIETLEFTDDVPRANRPGFRGFVEFDRPLERKLREAESSQHDRFDGRNPIVKAVRSAIEAKVREFAKEQGWTSPESTREAPRNEQDIARDFFRFLAPTARRRQLPTGDASSSGIQLSLEPAIRWECQLRLDLPDSRTTRVNWGQSIENVETIVRAQSSGGLEAKRVTVTLELKRVGDNSAPILIASQEVAMLNGEAVAAFGNYQVITGTPLPQKLQCDKPGKWRILTRVTAGTEVAHASRSIFVHEDPPEQEIPKPYALSISVENHSDPRRGRINSRDIVGVQINVTNRTPDAIELELEASLGNSLLADGLLVEVSGTPLGDSPKRASGYVGRIIVNPSVPQLSDTSLVPIELPPGRHHLRADLRLKETGEIIAYASKGLDIEVDPAQQSSWPPFQIEQIPGEDPHPRWQFRKQSDDEWVLQYPLSYPIYRALNANGSRNGLPLAGGSAFIVEICAEGLIEWSLEPLDHGDRSRLEELVSGVPEGSDFDRWQDYCDAMEELARLRPTPDDPDQYFRRVRACVSVMLHLFEARS